jgi:hypothetical protein
MVGVKKVGTSFDIIYSKPVFLTKMVQLKILIQAILLWLELEKFDVKFHEVVKLAGINNSSVTTTPLENSFS